MIEHNKKELFRAAFNHCGVDYREVYPNGHIDLIAGSTIGFLVGGTVFCFYGDEYSGHITLPDETVAEAYARKAIQTEE